MRNVHPQDSAHHDLAPPISQEAAREMLAMLKRLRDRGEAHEDCEIPTDRCNLCVLIARAEAK